jgi:arabinogalactan endo-1,4-beta-galactosidase
MRNSHPRIVLIGLACLCLICCMSISPGLGNEPSGNEFIRGVDASYVTRVEDKGGTYLHRDGTPSEVFEILSENGVNYIRFRIWNDPDEVTATRRMCWSWRGAPIRRD